MGQKQPDKTPRDQINFSCEACGHKFDAAPGRTEDAEDRPWHPFRYFADCTLCGSEAEQSGREVGLFKAWAHATGPRTPEGKARSSANLDGHPTPAESQLTRFNAMKHGAYAKTAQFFPAKPGKYPQCEGCEYLDTDEPEDSYCIRHRACLKQAELFIRYQRAFDAGDPGLLVEMQASRHASIQALIDTMILTVAQDGGPRIKSVEWYHDKYGGFHLAEWKDDNGESHQIHKLEEHPLLKRLMDYISKNSMTLADLGMTPKVQDEHALLEGHLSQQRGEREKDHDFRLKMADQTDALMKLVSDSYEDAEFEELPAPGESGG